MELFQIQRKLNGMISDSTEVVCNDFRFVVSFDLNIAQQTVRCLCGNMCAKY